MVPTEKLTKNRVTLIAPGAVGTDMQAMFPQEQRQEHEKLETLEAEDIAV